MQGKCIHTYYVPSSGIEQWTQLSVTALMVLAIKRWRKDAFTYLFQQMKTAALTML